METGEIACGTAMAALASQQSMLAYNLANLNSPAFKRKVGTFVELLSEQQGRDGRPLAVPAFTEAVDFSQGDVEHTHNDLDVAITGDGFFKVQTPWGPRFTRVGSFHPNERGEICTPSGYQLLGGNDQPLVVNLSGGQGAQILVDPVGTVRTKDGAVLGAIGLYRFAAPQRLEPLGDGLYACPADAIPEPDRASILEQGALEKANVTAISEFVNMLVTKRSFEAASQAIVQVQKTRDAFLAAARQ